MSGPGGVPDDPTAPEGPPGGAGADEEAVDERPRFVCFRVGAAELLTPVEGVQEVLVVGPCTRLPGAPAAVVGVTAVRGRIVAVVDPHPALGAGEAPIGADGDAAEARLLVVPTPTGPVALHVDGVDAVVAAEPAEDQAADPARPFVVGVVIVDGRRCEVVDPVAVIDAAMASGVAAEPAAIGSAGS